MIKNLEDVLNEFKNKYNCKVVFVTQYGSKLYGTDNANSDTDYKGIFIPSQKDVLLKRDLEHFTYTTNEEDKNSKEDIDIQLYSIYKWFGLLQKGETSALDLLFSFFREDTQYLFDKTFKELIRSNYTRFYNKNLHSFIGYCVGQSKMYDVKGKRYKELEQFAAFIENLNLKTEKLESVYPQIQEHFTKKNYAFIKFITASVSRGTEVYKEGVYVEVLGKRFFASVSVGYFLEKITFMKKQFGYRSKQSSTVVDFKALSHSVRVINEVEELLDNNFITFPLTNRVYVRSIKEGKESLESVIEYINNKLDKVQEKLEKSTLPQKSDQAFMDDLLLMLVSDKT